MKSTEQQNREYELRLSILLSSMTKEDYDSYLSFQALSQSLVNSDLDGEY